MVVLRLVCLADEGGKDWVTFKIYLTWALASFHSDSDPRARSRHMCLLGHIASFELIMLKRTGL